MKCTQCCQALVFSSVAGMMYLESAGMNLPSVGEIMKASLKVNMFLLSSYRLVWRRESKPGDKVYRGFPLRPAARLCPDTGRKTKSHGTFSAYR